MILRTTLVALGLTFAVGCTSGEEKQIAEPVQEKAAEPSEPGPAVTEPVKEATAAPEKAKAAAKTTTKKAATKKPVKK